MEIEIENLSKAYRPEKYVLSGINLKLRPPSMVGLIGPNGAGKTTFMKILVRQLLASCGSIKVDGADADKNENYLKSRLGYLPQEFGLYEELTVHQFLDYMAVLKGLGPEKKERIEYCIEKTGLIEQQNARIKTISGGQKQRVGIAQALLNDPEPRLCCSAGTAGIRARSFWIRPAIIPGCWRSVQQQSFSMGFLQ